MASLRRYPAEVAPLRLRPSSLERYRGIIDGQLVPILGRIPLASLTPEHVARAYAELAAPREVTINHARTQYTATPGPLGSVCASRRWS